MPDSGCSARSIVDPCATAQSPAPSASAALARRWRTVVVTSLVAAATATVWLAVTPPEFTASTSLMMPAGARVGIGVGSDGDLVSRAVLARVVDQRRLADDSAFVARWSGWRDRFSALVGLGQGARGQRAAAMDMLRNATTVRRAFRTYTIEVTAPDALEAANLADALAKAAVDARNASSTRGTETAASEPQGRAAALHARLVEAEAKLRAFEQASGLRIVDDSPIDDRQLPSLEAELIRAKTRNADAQAAVEELQQLLRSGRVPEAPAGAAASPAIERLLAQFQDAVRQEATDRTTLGDRHPAYVQVQARLREARRQLIEELRRLAGSAAARLAAVRSEEAELARQVEEARRAREAAAGPRDRLRALQGEVDVARADYVRAVQSDETTASSPEPWGARVVSFADVPSEPAGPDRLATLGLALAAGVLAGIAIAGFAESRARRRMLRGAPHDVPASPRRRRDSRRAHLFDNPRDCPDNRRSSRTGERAQVVLVTSDASGAGKSTIAVSLVRAACERGERTLLIEANAARPSLARLIEAEAAPTLIELAGTTRPSFAVDAGDGGGSFQLMAMLDDEEAQVYRLREEGAATIVGLEGHFDFVVIDGPTIGADDTASVLAEIADQVVLVVPPTARHERVASAIEQLQVPASKVRGTVLAAVEDLRIAA